jgi:O-methyltransferase involved in polyketide biosynthesis
MEGAPVLEIGSGFSPRGIAEATAREAYIESDLPEMLAAKRRVVASVLASSIPVNHHFVPFNACSTDDADRIVDYIRSLALERPLAVVNEGILMYLTADEQRVFRDNIRHILTRCSPRGAWITTDFSERDYEDTLLQRLMTRRLARRVQRRFNRFQSDEDVRTYLAEAGLVGEKLTPPLPTEASRDVRDVIESFRAWRISVR